MEPVIVPNFGKIVGAIGQLANKVNEDRKGIKESVRYSPEYLTQGVQIGIYAQDQDNYQIGLVYYTDNNEEGLQKVIIANGNRKIKSYKEAQNDFKALVDEQILSANPKEIEEISKIITNKGYILGYDGKQIFSVRKDGNINMMRSEFTKDEKQTSNEEDKEKMLICGMKAYICKKRESALNIGIKQEKQDRQDVTAQEIEKELEHIDNTIQERKAGKTPNNGFEQNFKLTYPILNKHKKSSMGLNLINEKMKHYLATVPERLSDNSEYKQYQTYLLLREQYSKALITKQQDTIEQVEQLIEEFVNSLENETKLKKFYEKLELRHKEKTAEEGKTR